VQFGCSARDRNVGFWPLADIDFEIRRMTDFGTSGASSVPRHRSRSHTSASQCGLCGWFPPREIATLPRVSARSIRKPAQVGRYVLRSVDAASASANPVPRAAFCEAYSRPKSPPERASSSLGDPCSAITPSRRTMTLSALMTVLSR